MDTVARAINLLRSHANQAAQSPWHARLVTSPDTKATSAVYSHAHPAGSIESEVVASGRIRPGYGGIRNPRNAAYIALMQPTVALAVADLLEGEANYRLHLRETGQPEASHPDHVLALAGAIITAATTAS